jgi:hypothetical protein
MAKTKKAPSIDRFDEHVEPRRVTLTGAGGKETEYLIGEIREGGVAWWLSNVTERFPEGEANYDGMMEDLIERCITYAETGNPVPRSTIDGWGDKCKQGLFRICRLVNGIDQEDADKQGK